jgi:hypothetical protein
MRFKVSASRGKRWATSGKSRLIDICERELKTELWPYDEQEILREKDFLITAKPGDRASFFDGATMYECIG